MAAAQPVRAVFLDLGNVLVRIHTDPLRRRLPDPEAAERLFADPPHPLKVALDTGRIEPAEFHARLAAELGLDMDYQEFTRLWTSIFTPEPEVERMVERLASHLPVYLLSNTDPIHFDYIRRRIPVLDRLAGWVLSYEVGSLKPDPAIFRKALERAGTPAHATVYVDDMPRYVEAARALGIRAVQYRSPARLGRELGSITGLQLVDE